MTNIPFRLQASVGCPRPTTLALALSAELREVDVPAVEHALESLASEVAGCEHDAPEQQLEAVTRLAGGFDICELPTSIDELLVDTVLEKRSGHALAVVVVVVEAALRSGLEIGVVGTGQDLFLAHTSLARPLVGEVRTARVYEVEREDGMHWRCSHQVAFTLIRELVEAALRTGDLRSALLGAELCLALPLGDGLEATVQGELRSLRARLN